MSEEERWRHWKRVNESKCLLIYAIYERPLDYPDRFVVRRWKVVGAIPTPEKVPMIANDLEDARACVPPDKMRLDRCVIDDPAILEVWL